MMTQVVVDVDVLLSSGLQWKEETCGESVDLRSLESNDLTCSIDSFDERTEQ
jgi:hypothetical protein